MTNAFGSWKFDTKNTELNISSKPIYDIHICTSERETASVGIDVKCDTATRFVFVCGLFSELFSLGLLKHIYMKHFPVCCSNKGSAVVIQDWIGWGCCRTGAERCDASFHQLSLPVILRPQIWSPELAKANYIGQTISISKYSQRIAFHYWHARQAEKLLSTQREREKRKQPGFPTCTCGCRKDQSAVVLTRDTRRTAKCKTADCM